MSDITMRLELVAVPVSDVDRAKEFYVRAGFNPDHDHAVGDGTPLRAADPARIGLLDRDRRGADGDDAGLGQRPSGGGRGHRGGSCRACRARRRGERRAGLPVGEVRLLQRPGRERLVGAADPGPGVGDAPMRRRLISGSSPYEGVAGFSRAVVAGDRVDVAGTAPIPVDGSPAAGGRLRAGGAVPRDHRRRARAGGLVARARRADEHLRHRSRALGGGRAGARGGVPRRPPRGARRRHRSCSTRVEGRDRGGGGAPVEADRPALDHRRRRGVCARQRPRAQFGAGDPYTLGVEEEYMLLDAESFDLVQHIDTVLAAIEGDELEPRINAELMQSVLEIATPVCRTAARRRRTSCAKLRALRHARSRASRDSRRLGRDAPVQPLRAPADHRARPLPAARRPAPVRRAARADLRHAHPRRGRRPREGDPGRERPARPPRPAARALRELAVLARRADGALVEPADRLRRVSALGAAAALPRLRRLRRGRRAARAHRLHRRLHAHLVGHPPASEARDGRGADLRRGHAGRGRGLASPPTARRSSSTTASSTTAARRSRRTTGS